MPRPVESEARVLAKLRELCLSLPDAYETQTWGHPNFRAGKKIFAAFHQSQGVPCIWVRIDPLQYEVLSGDARLLETRHGAPRWIALRADRRLDWKLARGLLEGGYRQVAPRALVEKLDAPHPRARRSA
jgi:predicted DNA-binding protein (MmcQ/YjbR family)